MIEELSLRNNPGSLLFQKRQRRVQKFTFELSESLQAVSKPSCALGEIKAKKEPVVSVKSVSQTEDLCGWRRVGGAGCPACPQEIMLWAVYIMSDAVHMSLGLR